MISQFDTGSSHVTELYLQTTTLLVAYVRLDAGLQLVRQESVSSFVVLFFRFLSKFSTLEGHSERCCKAMEAHERVQWGLADDSLSGTRRQRNGIP